MSKFIYKNKLKLIILFCFISGALIGSTVNLSRLYYGYDRERYNEACRIIEKNEKEASFIVQNIDLDDPDCAKIDLKNAKILWTENIRLYKAIKLIENLDRENMLSAYRLEKYCVQRLFYCSKIKKIIDTDDTEALYKELDKIDIKIRKILEGKGTMPMR